MTTQIPSSNKKVFFISFIISVLAIFAFISFIKFASTHQRIVVDKAVNAKHLDPAKVFDAPMQNIDIAYIDLGKFEAVASTTSTQPESIGCGDAIVMHSIEAGERAGIDQVDRVSFALQQLFDQSVFDSFKQGATEKGVHPYTALGLSRLNLKNIELTENQVVVNLAGKIGSGGVCDDPRIKHQLTSTINQFFPHMTVSIFINGIALEKVLSEK